MSNEVGVAYVRLLPSMRGFSGAASRSMKSGLAAPAKTAGTTAGTGIVGGIRSKIASGASSLKSGFRSAFGAVGLTALGVGAGALIMTGISQAFSNEAAEAKLAAQLGGSDWAKGMGKVAGNLYTEGFGESVTDTAAALKTTLQQGLLPEDATNAQVERMTAKVMTFSDVLDQDLNMSVQAVSTMLKSGLAKNADEAFDILTRGVQQGADKAGDLSETFQEYSTVFRDAGISGVEATGLMVQGLKGGARSADVAADALKEFAIRAQDGSTMSAKGFELLGMNAEQMTAKVAAGGPQAREALDQVLDGLRNMEDPVARNAAAVALFGTKAEDMGDALFAMDLDTAADAMGKTAGATDKLGEAYDTNAMKIETFKRKALDKLADGAAFVIEALKPLGKWVSENPGKFAALAAIVGGVVVVGFTAWAASAIAASIATGALLFPIIGIGIAIGAVAALFVIHWDTIKGAAVGAFNWIKTNWPLVLAILTGPVGLAVLAITKHWDKIKSGFSAVKDWIGDRIGEIGRFFGRLPGMIASPVARAFSGFMNQATKARDWVNRRIGDVVNFIRRVPGWIGQAVSSISSILTAPFKAAIAGIRRAWNAGPGGFGFTVPSWVPGVGGKGFRIPSMHTGGIVPGSGDVPILAEGGEGVFTREQMAALGGAAQPAAGAVLYLDAAGADRRFVEFLRHFIRVKGGGSVQLALGQ